MEGETGHKFLAIKNWHKYQGGMMKNRKDEKRMSWIKDYVDKEADPDYSKLSGFHRYILDGLCRLRGRIGQNLPNDPAYISRALGLIPAERSQAPRSVLALTSLGFLTLTNQQFSFTEERRGEEIREEKNPRGGDAVELHAAKSEPKAKAPPLRIVAAYDDDKNHVPKKPARFTQADFDARDLRKMNAAYEDLERAKNANLGRQNPLSEKEVFEHICTRAGITVARGIELEQMQKRWPGGSNVGTG